MDVLSREKIGKFPGEADVVFETLTVRWDITSLAVDSCQSLEEEAG